MNTDTIIFVSSVSAFYFTWSGRRFFTGYPGYHFPPRSSHGRWYSIWLNVIRVTNTGSSSSCCIAVLANFLIVLNELRHGVMTGCPHRSWWHHLPARYGTNLRPHRDD